jgi:hypothetical protein
MVDTLKPSVLLTLLVKDYQVYVNHGGNNPVNTFIRSEVWNQIKRECKLAQSKASTVEICS